MEFCYFRASNFTQLTWISFGWRYRHILLKNEMAKCRGSPRITTITIFIYWEWLVLSFTNAGTIFRVLLLLLGAHFHEVRQQASGEFLKGTAMASAWPIYFSHTRGYTGINDFLLIVLQLEFFDTCFQVSFVQLSRIIDLADRKRIIKTLTIHVMNIWWVGSCFWKMFCSCSDVTRRSCRDVKVMLGQLSAISRSLPS